MAEAASGCAVRSHCLLGLTEMLIALGRGGTPGNAEALGFMLRATFGGLRRHVRGERDGIVPNLRRNFC